MLKRIIRKSCLKTQYRNFQQARSLIHNADPDDVKRKGSAILIEKSCLFDPHGNPLETADTCLEFMKEMETNFLIVCRERTTEQEEYENFVKKFKLSFEVKPTQFATILSCMADRYRVHANNSIAVIGGHEQYFIEKGFPHIYTKSTAPLDTKNFIFSSLVQSDVDDNVAFLRSRLRQSNAPLRICAFQDGSQRIAKKMVNQIEEEHVKLTEVRPMFSYYTTGTLAFHGKALMERNLDRMFREVLYIGSVEHKSNLGSELKGVYVKDVQQLKSCIMAFITKTDLWD
jgi:hypothetical protein